MSTLQKRHEIQLEQQHQLESLMRIVRESPNSVQIMGKFDQVIMVRDQEYYSKVEKDKSLLQQIESLNREINELRAR